MPDIDTTGITMNHFLTHAVAAASLALSAFASSAATMTLSGWAWGKGNPVQVRAPAFGGLAGGFVGTLSGAPGFDGPISTYCVELEQHFVLGRTYTNYSVVDAQVHFGAERTDRLTRLLSFVGDRQLLTSADAGRRDDLSTSLQLAIWNIVYDNDLTLTPAADARGPFPAFDDTSVFAAGANTLLADAQRWTRSMDLFVLKSPTQQDQLIWRASAQAVPEPGSLVLAGMALAGLAAARRRRAG